MPTPFSHLHIATRLLDDPLVDEDTRAIIAPHGSAFLLGGIVADARVPGYGRDYTHFYHYTRPMPDHPWLEMLRQHPSLERPQSAAHCAFITGYVAHLAADEYWSRYMLKPHFADADWGDDRYQRFFWLHLLLIHMDERDEDRLPDDITERLRDCAAHDWLPFMPDSIIHEWQDFIADQIEGESRTLQIFGERVETSPDKLRRLVDDEDAMQTNLWQHVSPTTLDHIEADLYTFSREQMQIYVTIYGGVTPS